MLFRIGILFLFCCSLFGEEHVYLKAPDIAIENQIGTCVGVRPCRKTGIRIEKEFINDKCIIHNYGYGGSGLTLAFGGSSEVIKMLDNQESNIIAVLGGGVVGLATAYDLLELGYEVHVYADQWSPNLTSNIAAGIWTPLDFPTDLCEEKKLFHKELLAISEKRFLKSVDANPEFKGVLFMDYYRLGSQAPDVTLHLDTGFVAPARKTQRLSIEGSIFMADLHAKVKNKGASLNDKHFASLEDILHLEEPIIINCLSLGSKELFNDQDFIPVRGQMIYFKQNGMDYVLSQAVPDDPNSWVAFYPWHDRIVLGGIQEIGEDNPTIDPAVIENIMQNARKCLAGEL